MKKFLIILFGFSVAIQAEALTNQLKQHNSPYLAMHGDDPVTWQEWNPQTVKRAQQQNKLLFVSSGYFSCHWCHVMQRESYSNPEIARLLNKYFIPVKVDRELNASLDSRLIDFVEKTRGYAGWPLNVFITPDGHPLAGLVYLPAADFKSLLDNLIAEWQQRAPELKKVAAQASDELGSSEKITLAKPGSDFSQMIKKNFIGQALSQADEMQGGFGEQNKFPSVPQLDVLLDIYQQTKDQRIESFLRLSLNLMASQGLRDQLGGGFYRYAVDPGWQIPHFEKMLYDNALLASLYLKAAIIFNENSYQQVGRETLDFMLDEMSDETGAFYASFSAIDDKDVEGGYYLWHQDQLTKILSKDELRVVNELWQLEGTDDIEGGQHLVTVTSLNDIASQFKKPLADVNALFISARKKMLATRNTRSLLLDRKKVASWNGLVLSALVAGAQLDTGINKYHLAAKKLKNYILNNFWVGNQLHRAVASNAFGDAGLEDAAYLTKGLLDWALYSGNKKDLQPVTKLITASWQWFYSDKGWQLNQQPLLKYKEHSNAILDGVLPSPSAVLSASSLAVAKQLNDRKLTRQVNQHLNNVAPLISEQAFWYSTYLKAYH